MDKPVGFASIRGSLLLQNLTGNILLIDTSNESLLQEGQLYFYSPFMDNEDGKLVMPDARGKIKIIQAKAQEKNVYLS